MPKYVYKCNSCEECFEVYHGMSEEIDKCIHCSSEDPHRVPQMPFLKSSGKPRSGKVGDATKAAIEDNRALLEDMKRNVRENYYDDN